MKKVHKTIMFLFETLPNIHPFFEKKNFTLTLSNKPFLIWLLATASQLKYGATLLCSVAALKL